MKKIAFLKEDQWQGLSEALTAERLKQGGLADAKVKGTDAGVAKMREVLRSAGRSPKGSNANATVVKKLARA